MAETDLLTLDRKLALAARALDTWRCDLALEPRRDRDDPLAAWPDLTSAATREAVARSTLAPISTTPALLLAEPRASGDATLTTLGDLDPLAAIRPAFVVWSTHLAMARSLRDATAARAAAMRDELDCDSYGRPISLRAMLRALARPRQAGGVPEGRAAAAIEDLAPQLLTAVLDEEFRRRESAETLGKVAHCCLNVDLATIEQAGRYLESTEDEARELLAHGRRSAARTEKSFRWVDVLAVRRAADVAEGWPSVLSSRWLAELARGTELFAGLALDVRVDAARLASRADHAGLHLAPPTGAWSFGRALQALGVALHLHGRDPRTPFASHTVPHGSRPYVMGEAFLALASSPVFHARARGVARAKAELSARRMATTRLLERRHLALRVRLSSDLAAGRAPFLEAFRGLAEGALLAEVPTELAALLGSPGVLGPAEDAARFAALGPGDQMATELVERFDVDWWRNPKASSWVRDRCAR